MNDWQPIETAPRDRMILLYRPKAALWGRVTPGKYDSDTHAKRPRPFWAIWFRIGGVTEARQWPPTHWMPLPDAPGL